MLQKRGVIRVKRCGTDSKQGLAMCSVAILCAVPATYAQKPPASASLQDAAASLRVMYGNTLTAIAAEKRLTGRRDEDDR